MIRNFFLRLLGGGCSHQWEIYETALIWPAEKSEKPEGKVYMLRCTRCGDMKAHKLHSALTP